MNASVVNLTAAPGTTVAGIGGVVATILNTTVGQGLPTTIFGWVSFAVHVGVSLLLMFTKV